jgi:hypothetical protein
MTLKCHLIADSFPRKAITSLAREKSKLKRGGSLAVLGHATKRCLSDSSENLSLRERWDDVVPVRVRTADDR